MSDAILWFFNLTKARQRAVIAAVTVLKRAGIPSDEALCILHSQGTPSTARHY